jgi:hypothetical protein
MFPCFVKSYSTEEFEHLQNIFRQMTDLPILYSELQHDEIEEILSEKSTIVHWAYFWVKGKKIYRIDQKKSLTLALSHCRIIKAC